MIDREHSSRKSLQKEEDDGMHEDHVTQEEQSYNEALQKAKLESIEHMVNDIMKSPTLFEAYRARKETKEKKVR